jgi:hypothetical protein
MEVEATDRSLTESHDGSAYHVALMITVAFPCSPIWPTSNSAEFLSLEILLHRFFEWIDCMAGREGMDGVYVWDFFMWSQFSI